MKQRFWLWIDLSGIISCNTFSVVRPIINENEKNVLFYYAHIDLKYDNGFIGLGPRGLGLDWNP
jgi:hypothetical protein